MNTKNILVSAIVATIVVIIAFVVGGNNQPQTPINFGASGTRFPNGISADSTSPSAGEVRGADLTATDDLTVTDDVTISGDTVLEILTRGGTNTATSSTAATYTLLQAELTGKGVIQWTPNVNTTVTLPATSTLTTLVPNSGDIQSFWFYNASSTAAATITIAAGTGIDLQKNEDTADLAINGLDWAELIFIRQADTDVTVIMSEFIEAD